MNKFPPFWGFRRPGEHTPPVRPPRLEETWKSLCHRFLYNRHYQYATGTETAYKDEFDRAGAHPMTMDWPHTGRTRRQRNSLNTDAVFGGPITPALI